MESNSAEELKILKKKKNFKNQIFSKKEVTNIIDKFKILNRIIEINLGNDLIFISTNDLRDFISIVFYLSKNFDKENMKYILNSNHPINLTIDDEDQDIIKENLNLDQIKISFTKYLILLISFLIYVSSTNKNESINHIEYIMLVLKLIKKLYRNNIIEEKEISLILKFILTMSLFKKKITEIIDIKGKNIKNILLIWLVLDFLNSLSDLSNNQFIIKEKSMNLLLEDLLLFFNEKILINYYNLVHLGDSTKFLCMLDIIKFHNVSDDIKIKLVEAVARVYANRLNIDIMNYIMKNIAVAFVNVTNEIKILNYNNYLNQLMIDIRIINISLNFIKLATSTEKEKLDKGEFIMKHGFLLNESQKTTLSIAPIMNFPEKGYSLIFSFKWTPEIQNINSRMYLISFVQEKEKLIFKKEDLKDFYLLSIYIENQKLFIQLNDIWDTNFIVEPNQSYLVIINQLQPGFFSRSKCKIYININKNYENSIEINGYPSGKMKCLIGHQYKFEDNLQKIITIDHFSGLMGTIILFKSLFGDEIIKKFYEMEGDYEKILYKSYETFETVSKYAKSNAIYFFQQFDKYKFEEKVVMLISSRVRIFLIFSPC